MFSIFSSISYYIFYFFFYNYYYYYLRNSLKVNKVI